MSKLRCGMCRENYKMLTRESLCALCYQKRYKKWSIDFTANEENK